MGLAISAPVAHLLYQNDIPTIIVKMQQSLSRIVPTNAEGIISSVDEIGQIFSYIAPITIGSYIVTYVACGAIASVRQQLQSNQSL